MSQLLPWKNSLLFFWRWSDGKEVIKGVMREAYTTASYSEVSFFCLPIAPCVSSPVTRVSRSFLFKKRENETPKEDAACTAFRCQDKTYLYPQDTP